MSRRYGTFDEDPLRTYAIKEQMKAELNAKQQELESHFTAAKCYADTLKVLTAEMKALQKLSLSDPKRLQQEPLIEKKLEDLGIAIRQIRDTVKPLAKEIERLTSELAENQQNKSGSSYQSGYTR